MPAAASAELELINLRLENFAILSLLPFFYLRRGKRIFFGEYECYDASLYRSVKLSAKVLEPRLVLNIVMIVTNWLK